MTFSDTERAAMRRALALAASDGVPLGPNPRVGCVLLDADGRDHRRGPPPGAGTPHAEVDALAQVGGVGPGRHRRRHARAVQPHRPHRSLLAGARGGRRTTGGRRPARPQPGRGRWRGDPARRRRRGRDRPPGRRGTGPQPGLDLRRRARPPVRDLEVRHHPRRAQRRRRRHQPLGLQPGRATRHPPTARPVRHDAGRHRHGRGRRPAPHRPRRGRRPAAAPAAARGDGGARPRPRPPDPRRRRRDRCTCAPATPRPRSRSSSPATGSTSSSRGVRRSPPRSCRPASSTRSWPTSRRCCSAPAAARWATWESPRSPRRCTCRSPTSPSWSRSPTGTTPTYASP